MRPLMMSFSDPAATRHRTRPRPHQRASHRAISANPAFRARKNQFAPQCALLAAKFGMALECIQPPKPFQAEYEGSIPFTRSKFINDLACERFLLPTNRAEYFRQSLLHLFAKSRATETALEPNQCRRSSRSAALCDALQLCLALAGVVAV
jgi:hypothetical protein